MSKLWRRVRQRWPGQTIHLPVVPAYWAALMAALGQLRGDHVAVAGAALALGFGTHRTSRFLRAFYGYVMVGVLYDATRFVRDVGLTPQRVLLCNLRRAELAAFGLNAGGRRITLQDWFFHHHHLAADVFFAVPYGLFLIINGLYAVYLFFEDEDACARYCWVFFLLNLMAFATYHLTPAAPPWYFHRYGCAVDLAAAPSEGPALARVDALFGMSYFRTFYGRASEIFGAIPSLHAAYPLLIIIEGWRRHGRLGRALAIAYLVWMCSAAVYLDHHWVVDLIVGWVYCVVAISVMRKLIPLRGEVELVSGASAVLAPSDRRSGGAPGFDGRPRGG